MTRKAYHLVLYWLVEAIAPIIVLPVVLVRRPNRALMDLRAIGRGDMKRCQHCAEVIKPPANVRKRGADRRSTFPAPGAA